VGDILSSKYEYGIYNATRILCGAGSMSVRLSARQKQRRLGFAGERHTGRRYRSIVAGAVLQAAALSSKCG